MRKPKRKLKKLSVRVEHHASRPNVVDYTEHTLYTDLIEEYTETIRIRIHIDSYRAQAYGVIERWSIDGWQEIARMTGGALVSDCDMGYMPTPPTAALFINDRVTLLGLAAEILQWQPRP